MRFLQNIIQSVNTSIQLLRHTVHRLNIDVILLQEIWQPSDGSITIKNYSQPITKFRQGGKGGGVAIIPHRKVKIVHLKEYDMDGLKAVWAVILINKVQTVIGSVYVPPGDMSALSILDTVISKILTSFSHILIAINANSRSTLWDDMCAGISQSRRSVQMGSKLEDIIDKYGLEALNTGCPTYRSGNITTAPDVTLIRGSWQRSKVCWSVIDDDLRSPHEGILIDIGDRVEFERKEVIDWNKFDWEAYCNVTGPCLQKLYDHWVSDIDIDIDKMASELISTVENCVEEIATRKIVTKHSKPWISPTISSQLKLLRKMRKKCRHRKSPFNISEYKKLQKDTKDMLDRAESEWLQLELKKLSEASEREKWKIIRRLTNDTIVAEVQPVRKLVQGKHVYLFDDHEIRNEFENHHIRKISSVIHDPVDEDLYQSLQEAIQAAKEGGGNEIMLSLIHI